MARIGSGGAVDFDQGSRRSPSTPYPSARIAGICGTKWLVNVLVPVAVGAAIYLLWRPTYLIAFTWVQATGLDNALTLARGAVRESPPPDIVLHCVPGGLWAYSFGCALGFIHKTSTTRIRALAVATGAGLGVASEVGQLLQILPGTFDVRDICAYAMGAALAWITVERNEA